MKAQKAKMKAQKATKGQNEEFRGLPPWGDGRGFAPSGLGYCLRKADQAYAGCLSSVI